MRCCFTGYSRFISLYDMEVSMLHAEGFRRLFVLYCRCLRSMVEQRCQHCNGLPFIGYIEPLPFILVVLSVLYASLSYSSQRRVRAEHASEVINQSLGFARNSCVKRSGLPVWGDAAARIMLFDWLIRQLTCFVLEWLRFAVRHRYLLFRANFKFITDKINCLDTCVIDFYERLRESLNLADNLVIPMVTSASCSFSSYS